MDHDDDPHDERSEQVRSALAKALAVVVVIAVLIALGTVVVVRALGLNESDSTGSSSTAPSGPTRSLPTTALPVPGEDSASGQPSAEPSKSTSPKNQKKKAKLQLKVSPLRARTGERVNLTGTYRGVDNVGLQVQRFQDGDWRDFGVQATVRVGTYETYIMTGRTGEQRFRMWDPKAQKSSNVVLVTIS